MKQDFTLGLTYRPRLAGFRWWEQFDPIATHEELAQIADFGCNTLRICLTWEYFQPSIQRVGVRAMQVLEQTLDAAQQAGLQVVPVLFPVAEAGVLMLPDWANRTSLIDELTNTRAEASTLTAPQPNALPILIEGRYRLNQTRDLFSYRPIVNAQRYLIREVVGYFGSHPAIWAWQLGEGLERAHPPSSLEAVHAWYTSMAEAIREQRPKAQILGVTSMDAMARQTSLRPEQITQTCDMLGVTADPPEPPATARRHTTTPTFTWALASGLATRSAIVTSLGMPTTMQRGGAWVTERIFGRSQQIFYADHEQHAAFMDAAFNRLDQAGVAGIWLAAYSDYAQIQSASPPFDSAPRIRTLGLLDAQGNEKPATSVVRDFAARLRTRTWQITAVVPQAIDSERHWHDPQRSIADLWAGFEPE